MRDGLGGSNCEKIEKDRERVVYMTVRDIWRERLELDA
jgi:hypothetical protein